MLGHIAACRIYVSTVKETFGAQTVEAMAMGKPVLGYNFGGNTEILAHLSDSYLVEPGSDLREGAEYILAHYDEMSAAARITALRYDWYAIVPFYVQQWEKALDVH